MSQESNPVPPRVTARLRAASATSMHAARRLSDAVRIVRDDGARALMRRVVLRLAKPFEGDIGDLPLFPADVTAAESMQTPAERVVVRDRGLEIGWVCTPPSAGSGGHTTLLRFVDALEQAGHRCVLYVYDRFGGDVRSHENELRGWWPHIRAEVRDVKDGLSASDAFVATSWTTAHVLARRGDVPGTRFYLAQDFEPYFYARGSEYALAEETYRYGFHCITVGHMVAGVLRDKFGTESVVAEFGCETATYSLAPTGPRAGVVFYTKPDTPRRGYLLGVLALEQFHELHPDVPIHTFGALAGKLPFPAAVERHMPPAKLAELYNGCVAGLALSFTNVSLITYELLACGVVPVVNDSPFTRADLDNPFVGWARPNPASLAGALSQAVSKHRDDAFAAAVAGSVADMSWEPARRVVVETIERQVGWGSR
jgi:hypothetical protein